MQERAECEEDGIVAELNGLELSNSLIGALRCTIESQVSLRAIVVNRAFIKRLIKGPINLMVTPREAPSTPQNSLFELSLTPFDCMRPLETY